MRYAQLLLCLFAAAAALAFEATRTRILVPVASAPGTAAPVPGGFGSTWVVETWLHYTGDDNVHLTPATYVCFSTCDLMNEIIPPRVPPRPVRPWTAGPAGFFMYLPRNRAREFFFQSRVFETSRAFTAAGTVLPIAEECDFRPTAHLLDVPLVSGSRTRLRIYGTPEAVDPVVIVRYFRRYDEYWNDYFVLLREETVRLVRPTRPHLVELFLQPSFGFVADVGAIPELVPHKSVRIEVVAASPDLRVWALASITDNVTQQLTLIAPQSPCGGQ